MRLKQMRECAAAPSQAHSHTRRSTAGTTPHPPSAGAGSAAATHCAGVVAAAAAVGDRIAADRKPARPGTARTPVRGRTPQHWRRATRTSRVSGTWWVENMRRYSSMFGCTLLSMPAGSGRATTGYMDVDDRSIIWLDRTGEQDSRFATSRVFPPSVESPLSSSASMVGSGGP